MGELEHGLMLRRSDWLQMRHHILDVLPEEACGLVGGKGGCSKVVFDVENILRSKVRFRMEANAQIRAFLEMEELDLDLMAIYHSHPEGPGQPSQTDLEEFAYPGTAYLIWYPESGDWSCKAFSLSEAEFHEIPFTLVEVE